VVFARPLQEVQVVEQLLHSWISLETCPEKRQYFMDRGKDRFKKKTLGKKFFSPLFTLVNVTNSKF
jgi:hypothetical protein